MFIWDFVADTVLGQIIDWLYGQIVGFLGDFFMQMGSMGAELFEMSWVQSVVLLFYYLAWALYVTGIVVAAFECGIEYQNGRGSIRDTALNVIKGFLAASLFTTVPVELYKLSISLQGSFTAGITGLGEDIGTVAAGILQSLQDAATWQEAATSGVFGGIGSISSPIFMIFLLILMAVGSLYLFSVPRGYIDGFVGWCKQVIGLCLTAFLQATVLIAGLMVVKDQALLGLGLMLSAGEIPRIAGQFGLETGTKANVMGAVYAAQGAMNLTRTVVQVVSK